MIDTGPEFRLQGLRANITKLDGVFLTHAHADHVHGLDDLRPFCYDKPMPVYANQYTLDELRERFSYVFKDTQKGGGKPRITPIIASEPIRIGRLTFTPIPVKHGVLDILGWSIGEDPGKTAVYLTDTSNIPEDSFRLISKPEAAVIGGLRNSPHETHFSFAQALAAGLRIGAPHIYLTHICHDHSHQEIEAFCRSFQKARNIAGIMQPGYDGQELLL